MLVQARAGRRGRTSAPSVTSSAAATCTCELDRPTEVAEVPDARVRGGTPSDRPARNSSGTRHGSDRSRRPSSSWASRTTAARIDGVVRLDVPPARAPAAVGVAGQQDRPGSGSVTRSEATACHVSLAVDAGGRRRRRGRSSSTPARLRGSARCRKAEAIVERPLAVTLGTRGDVTSATSHHRSQERRGARQHCRRGAWPRPPRVRPDPRTPTARRRVRKPWCWPPEDVLLAVTDHDGVDGRRVEPDPLDAVRDHRRACPAACRSSSVPLTKSKCSSRPARVSTPLGRLDRLGGGRAPAACRWRRCP